jgi:TRAP-type C4-dicarboxylate transport system substrate-binding protein
MKRLALTAFAIATTAFAHFAGAQTVLTVSSWLPPSHALSATQKDWCDLLEKNTTGKMKCNILPRGVSAPTGTFDAVKNGLADVSYTVHGYTPGRFVLAQMAEFPFLGNSAESISVAFNKIAARHPQFNQEHQGVKVLALFTHGPGIVFNTKRPIAKVEDLGGLKFRVGGGMVNEISKTLGMNVTLKPAPESYELLSGGVMDGTLFPAESTEYNTSFVAIMNQARYDKLSAEEKKAIDAISGETYARMFGRAWDKVDLRATALMQANGVQITKSDAKFVADVKTRTSGLETKWVTDAQAAGLKDAAKVLTEFRAEIAKQEK